MNRSFCLVYIKYLTWFSHVINFAYNIDVYTGWKKTEEDTRRGLLTKHEKEANDGLTSTPGWRVTTNEHPFIRLFLPLFLCKTPRTSGDVPQDPGDLFVVVVAQATPTFSSGLVTSDVTTFLPSRRRSQGRSDILRRPRRRRRPPPQPLPPWTTAATAVAVVVAVTATTSNWRQ